MRAAKTRDPPVRITPTSYDGFVLVRAFDDTPVEVEAILEPEPSWTIFDFAKRRHMRDAQSMDLDRAIVFASGGFVVADLIEFHGLTRRNREIRPHVLKIGGDAEAGIRLNY